MIASARREPWLLVLLAAAVLSRVVVAIAHLDQVWADEHFQTLEPAATLVYDFGWLTWEWREGVRSWLVPALYVPVLAACKAIGLQGGPAVVVACRVVTALASLWFLARVYAVLRPCIAASWARLCAFAGVALAPAMVVFGAATLADTWVALFLWSATASAMEARAFTSGARLAAFRCGLWLGLAFVVRPQSAPWALGLIGVLAVRRGERPLALAVLAGLVAPVLAHGLLDWAVWGAPFHSTIAYARVHLVEGVSQGQGVSPAWAYGPIIVRNLGVALAVAPLLAALAALVTRRLKFDGARALALLPALALLVAHVFVPHKEARFVFPIYPALFALGGMALADLAAPMGLTASIGLTGVRAYAAPIVVALALASTSLRAVPSPTHFEPSDASDAARFVHDDGGLRRHPEACWLFVQHGWLWSRGELLAGQRVRRLEVDAASLASKEVRARASSCAYALVRSDVAASAALLGPPWRLAHRGRWGHLVLRNERILGASASSAAVAPVPLLAGEAPPKGAREVPVESVPAATLVRLYREALERAPENVEVRRRFAELCRARRLPCALEQYRELLRRAPADAELGAIVRELEAAAPR